MDDILFNDMLRDTLGRHLADFPRRGLESEGRRRAAVAIAVVPDETGQAAVVLTVRASGLRRHGGQWALPGGRTDPEESAEEAALRELAEEVGLTLPRGAVLGCLDDFPSRSGFVITPVVVWGRDDAEPRPVELTPDPREVASAHLAPVAEIGVPENLLIVPLRGNPLIHPVPESDRPLLALALLGTTIFSPTAAMLYQFSEAAVHGRATRVAHYEQPRFAWS